jgi:hypothetical protein
MKYQKENLKVINLNWDVDTKLNLLEDNIFELKVNLDIIFYLFFF